MPIGGGGLLPGGAMKKIWEYLVDHGMTVMLSGFVVAVAGLLAFAIRFRYHGGWIRTLSIAVVIAGFVLYVLGRVLFVLQRRGGRRGRSAPEEDLKS